MKSIEEIADAQPLEQPARRRPYRTGAKATDEAITALVTAAGVEHGDLVAEMITTAVRLGRENANRGEMRMINRALKELRYERLVFAQYPRRRKVTMFGSARTLPSEPGYVVAREFAEEAAKRGWMVITGAGGGIMEAGIEGAGIENAFGLHIDLPFEPRPTQKMRGDPKLVNFRYFFTRKVAFVKESDAFVLLPGGFGTLDEAFELLTLMQTGRSDLKPVVLLERGGAYWKQFCAFVEEHLSERGMISPEDIGLIKVSETVDEAVDVIEGFYHNFDSERYVRGQLVFRLRRLPPPEALEQLSHEFADMLASGGFRPVEPSPEEVADDDGLELKRIAFDFDRQSSGRLRQFIDALNRF
ncbi:MAG: TIGR00730 family Rossman fold protein [Dehalococcoidia bacterium]|nr:TIGR00730 family Rossman fold protein [Dehalococcoidia bacterium]